MEMERRSEFAMFTMEMERRSEDDRAGPAVIIDEEL